MSLRAIPGEPGRYEVDGTIVSLGSLDHEELNGPTKKGCWRLCFWCATGRAWTSKGWSLPDGWRVIEKLHGTTTWMCPACVKTEMPE